MFTKGGITVSKTKNLAQKGEELDPVQSSPNGEEKKKIRRTSSGRGIEARIRR
jgi:hypothetical protein